MVMNLASLTAADPVRPLGAGWPAASGSAPSAAGAEFARLLAQLGGGSEGDASSGSNGGGSSETISPEGVGGEAPEPRWTSQLGTQRRLLSDVEQPLSESRFGPRIREGELKFVIADRQTGERREASVPVVPQETSLSDLAAALNDIPGLQAQVDGRGRLEITASHAQLEFAVTDDAAGVLAALGQANPEMRKVFDDFVGQTFFGQMLKSMRASVGKPAYFHGGRGEEVFQAQLDQVLAEKLSTAQGGAFSDAMYDQMFHQIAR